MIRVIFILLVMSISAVIFVRYAKRHNKISKNTDVEVLASLRLSGRDIFYVIKCGSQVIAFVSGSSGACKLGDWNYEDWIKNGTDNNF